jgi:type IV pilus assembly protein PilC
MPVYRFRGRDIERGSQLVGQEYAEDKHLLARKLRNRGILPITIIEERGASRLRNNGPGAKALALFARQLAVMLQAGLPLVQCLTVLSEQQERSGFRTTLLEVQADVESGSTLADALLKHPRTFDRLFIDMVEAGELGGFLDVAFKRLALYIQRAVKIKSQALAASIYPLVVLVAAFVTISLTLVWVVPVFVSLFQGLDVPLPFLTRLVIWFSDWVTRLGIPFILFLVLTMCGVHYLRRRPEGRLFTDRVLLGIPLLGKILARTAVARFSLTLATLLGSGVPLLKGLEVAAASSGNSVFQQALRSVRKEVLNGRAVFRPMEESGVFPPLVTRMVAVGEEAGELDKMLEHLSDFYEEESEQAVSQMMTALEPVLVVLLGVLVGGIVLSMYLPIFGLVGHFAH